MTGHRDDLPSPANDVPILDRPVILDPWLAASALQKAIRRGEIEEGWVAASTLLRIQPDRFWRRLVVIDLEDAGVANLNMALQVLLLSGQKAYRRDFGGDWGFAAHLVRGLARGPKSREACDLLVVADLHPVVDAERTQLARAPAEKLAETLMRPDLPLPVRALASWFLAGTVRFAGFNLRKRPGRYAVLAEVYEKLGVPFEVMRVARMGSTRTREPHPVTLPLAWLELGKSVWREERAEDLPEAPLIGGWPAPAYDMHTRQGRQALALFAETCAPVRECLLAHIPETELIEVVGALVFRAEGGLVDQRLCHEGSNALLRSADEAQVGWGTFPLAAVPEALALVRAHLGDLNTARRKVIGDRG